MGYDSSHRLTRFLEVTKPGDRSASPQFSPVKLPRLYSTIHQVMLDGSDVRGSSSNDTGAGDNVPEPQVTYSIAAAEREANLMQHCLQPCYWNIREAPFVRIASMCLGVFITCWCLQTATIIRQSRVHILQSYHQLRKSIRQLKCITSHNKTWPGCMRRPAHSARCQDLLWTVLHTELLTHLVPLHPGVPWSATRYIFTQGGSSQRTYETQWLEGEFPGECF